MELVGQGLETKEIGQRLGIAPSTVDGYIKSARAKLGGIRRREAARRIAAPQSVGGRSLGMPDTPIADPEAGHDEALTADRLAEAATPFLHEPLDRDAPPPAEERRDDLTVSALATITAALKIAVLLLIVLLAASTMMSYANANGRPLLPYLR